MKGKFAMRTTAIHVGANRDAIKEARGAINDILSAEVYEETKRSALDCLRGLCEVKNTTISNNTFSQ